MILSGFWAMRLSVFTVSQVLLIVTI